MTSRIARFPTLVAGVVLGILVAIGRLLGGGSAIDALIVLLIAAGYAVVITILGRRSETAGVLAGRPVDERWEHLSLEACAWAFGATALVVLGALVVTEAGGGAWQPYALLAAVMATAYVGSLLVLRARH